MITLNLDQSIKLQALLIATSLEFYETQKDIKLTDLSLHVTPDSSWISAEHEVEITDPTLRNTDRLIRKAPSCHQILLKL